MKLTDLKRTIKEPIEATMEAAPADMPTEVYPYGLQIRLGEDELTKLGIDVTELSVEEKVGVVANGYISELENSESFDQDSKGGKTRKRQCLAIQLTGLALGKPVSESSGAGTKSVGTLRQALSVS